MLFKILQTIELEVPVWVLQIIFGDRTIPYLIVRYALICINMDKKNLTSLVVMHTVHAEHTRLLAWPRFKSRFKKRWYIFVMEIIPAIDILP